MRGLVSRDWPRRTKPFIRYALRRANLVLSSSQELLDMAHGQGVKKERLHVMGFGVDTQMFNPEVNTQILQEQLNLGPGPVVLSPRPMLPMYGLLRIVEAIPKVLQAFPTCTFIFQTRSEHHRPEYEAELKSRLIQLGVGYSVRILPQRPYEEMPALFACADVIVSVPSADAASNSVFEGMACGAFPVISDIPAFRGWVRHEENGLLLQTIEADQVADAIVRALSDKNLASTIRTNNLELIRTRQSASYWTDRLEELYRATVAGKSYSHA